MTSKNSVVCPSCGYVNKVPLAKDRCISCGAKVGSAERTSTRQAEVERRYQQQGFSVAWFGISLVVVAVLTVAVIVGLPMVVPLLDFEGSAGAMMTIPVWFGAGLLVGLISPGRTFAEPVAATVLVSGPTVWFLINSQTVKVWPSFLYGLMAILGVVFALIGAYAGERFQTGGPVSR
jgi:predicted nucleic acid-binding Zn ribbon protein